MIFLGFIYAFYITLKYSIWSAFARLRGKDNSDRIKERFDNKYIENEIDTML